MQVVKTTLRPLRTDPEVFLVFDKKTDECYGAIKRVIVERPIGWEREWNEEHWMGDGNMTLFDDRRSAINDLMLRTGRYKKVV